MAGAAPARMVGYVRVSTEEQAEEGYGLDAQELTLRRAFEYRGWTLVELIREEGLSGSTLERSGLQRALRAIARGDADGLVVAKLDRLTRSTRDFCELVDWFEDAGGALVMLEPDVDTSSPTGRAVAQVMVAFAELERGLIRERTKAALHAKRTKGERTGRPAVADRPALAVRIQQMREDGMTLQAIADQLTAEGVPTARGAARWRPSSVQSAAGYQRPAPKRRRGHLPAVPRSRRPRR